MRLEYLLAVAAWSFFATVALAQPLNPDTGKPNQTAPSAPSTGNTGKPVELTLKPDQSVFVVDDLVKISPEGKLFSRGTGMEDYAQKNAVWDGKTIKLAGAKGERLGFQVMVSGGPGGLVGNLSGVALVATDLTFSGDVGGKVPVPVPAKNFAFFREWYVEVTRPSTSPFGNAGLGWYPDALIPAETPKFGLPVKVEAGKLQGIWVDLVIPTDAFQGPYAGKLTVANGAQNIAELPVELTIYNFAIPAQRHLRWRIGYTGFESVPRHYGINPGTPEHQKIEDDLFKMSWEDCRFVPTTHYNTPRVKSTGKGADFKFDWTEYDARFGKYLDGSAFADHQPVNIWSLPINVDAGIPTGGRVADLSKLDTDTLAAAVKDAVAHWKAKGWRIEDTFVYIADEPSPERYAFIKKACETVLKASDNKIRTSVALYTHFGDNGPVLVKEFAGYVTMWDIAGDYMNVDALRGRQAAGDTIGFYQGAEPFEGSEALDGDGLSMATWPWIAWRYKLDTLFLYNMTEWDYFRLDRGTGANKPWAKLPRDIWTQPLNQSWQTSSQGVLIYPGDKVGIRGVVTSVRMKQIRRGMQDYEYFWMLKNGGQAAKAEELCKAIVPRAWGEATGKYGDGVYGNGPWERDPRKWAGVRGQMAALLSK